MIGRSRAPTTAVGAIAALVLIVACASPLPSPPNSTSASVAPSSSASPAATPSQASAAPADVALELVATGIAAPIGLVSAPDGSGRSFIVDQTGRIYILKAGTLLPEPFLDISAKLVELMPDYDERGLLGLAFHPDFATNGRFFVYYGAPLGKSAEAGQDHTNALSEFKVSASNPDRADPGSERRLLQFEQPQFNHSGGALGFGPESFLYLGAGDGGGRGDASEGHSPQGNAQDTQKLNGKIMRIDVDRPGPGDRAYGIPADNPFASGGGRPEIYAYGFRNPWRLTWEPDGARRLLVSDVGFGRYEEIDAVVKGGDYGWRIREGRHCLDLVTPLQPLASCSPTGDNGDPLIDPVIEYSHKEVGTAVVGGYVYRGSAMPALKGQYIFGDFTAEWTTPAPSPRATLMASTPMQDNVDWGWRRLSVAGGEIAKFLTGLGEDDDGEIYAMTRTVQGPTGLTGEVSRLVAGG